MMKNKKRNFLLIWILALALLLNVLAFVPVVADDGPRGPIDLATVGDFDYKITYKADGEEIDDGDEVDINEVLEWFVNINFDIPDGFKFEESDFLEIDLSGLKNIVDPNVDDGRIEFAIEGGDKVNAARYQILEGPKLKIVFDNNLGELNDKKDREGFVELSFAKEDRGGEVREEIRVPINNESGEITFTVIRKNSGGSAITKKGDYDSASDRVIWTIDVNTELANLTNVIIVDELPEGLTFVMAEIAELTVKTDSLTEGAYSTVDHIENDDSVTISLGNLEQKASRLKITTTLDENLGGPESITLTNKATLNADGEFPITVTADVVFQRLVGVEKTAEVKDNSKIVWTIKYLGDGTTELTDILTVPTGLDIRVEDVKVNDEEHTDYTLSYVKNDDNSGSLTITFTGLPDDKTEHTIEYTTATFFDGKSESPFELKNKAKYGGKSDSKSASIEKDSILTKEKASIYQLGNDTIVEWTIEVNRNNEDWHDVYLREYVPEGFAFVSAWIKGKHQIEVKDIKYIEDDESNSPYTSISLGSLYTSTKLAIVTKVDDFSIFDDMPDDKITNKARLEWRLKGLSVEDDNAGNGQGIGNGNPEHLSESKLSEWFTGEFSVEDFKHTLMKWNTGKTDYTSGKTGWKVVYQTFITSIEIGDNGFVITDEIKTESDEDSNIRNHKYDTGSFEINLNNDDDNKQKLEETTEGVKKTVGEDTNQIEYSLTFTEDLHSYTFTLWSGNINPDGPNRLVISYDTKFDLKTMANAEVPHRLQNTAEVENASLQASAFIDLTENVSRNGVKTGSLEEGSRNIFNWTAKLNFKGKEIKAEDEIVDTLQGGDDYGDHKYVKESLLIFEATIKEDGSLQEGSQLATTAYSVAYNDDDNKMTITFKKDLTHPIIIKYQTKAVGIAQEKYKNELKYDGMTYSETIERDDYEKFLSKDLLNGRGQDNDRVVKGDVLEWKMDVNENLSEIHDFLLTDTSSEGLVLIPDSVEIWDGETLVASFAGSYTDGGFTLAVDSGNPNTFTLSKELVDKHYIVKYRTLVVGDVGNNVNNKVSIKGSELAEITIMTDDYRIYSASSAGGTGREGELELKVIKVDKDNNPITSSPANFMLTIKTTIGDVPYEVKHPFTTGPDGSFVTEITPNKWTEYILQETQAPKGYILNADEVTIDFNEAVEKIITLNIKNKEILKVDLEVKKTLLGQALYEGQFEFELSELKAPGEEPGLPMTASNDANGNVTFKNIEFEKAGTYWFKITETEDDENSTFMTYDDTVFYVKVVIKDSTKKLELLVDSISYYEYVGPTDDDILLIEDKVAEFTNTYKASGSFTAEFQKKLTGGGRKIENEEFTFVLTPVSNAPLRTSAEDGSELLTEVETTNGGDGKFSFELFFNQDDLALEPSKEFQYTVEEIDLNEDGMKYDATVYTVTVKVEDNRQGTLDVTATYEAGEGTSGVFDENGTPIFTNIYEASGTWSPKVTKKLFGRGLRNEEFTFTLERYYGEIQPTALGGVDLTAKNNASGVVAFEPIEFTENDIGETFEFIVREVKPTSPEGGMRYDENQYKVSVKVKDAGDGNLEFEEEYYLGEVTAEGTTWKLLTDDGITFINRYSAGNAWTPNVTKELVGRELKDKEFEFVLKGPQGNVIEKIKNDADGNVVFSSIGFSEADIGGSYTYTIEEVVGSEPGMSYDTRSIKINVSISDAGGGVLNINASYPAVTTFVNRYSGPSGITVTANKVWKDLPSGWTEHLPTIWFKLYRSVEGKTAEAVPGLALQKLPAGVTQVSWNGLEKYDPDGELYVYSVKEVDENGKDYEPKYFEKTEKGLTVTNAFIKERVEGDEDFETEIDVTGHKVWKGVPKGQTVPTIWLRLYRHIEGGTPVAVPGRPIMELRPGVTQGTWKDLEKVDEDYNYYIYTVKEVDSKGNDYEPPHFRKTEEGLTVTNTHTAGAPVTGETLSVYTIMGAMLMALAALFLILTGRKRAKAK